MSAPSGSPEWSADVSGQWSAETARLRRISLDTNGFMPVDEGDLLLATALARAAYGPLLEVGTWCGKTAILLGAAARHAGTVAFTVDHHRGSEENQPGWEWHDSSVVDARVGRIDTLPFARAALTDAGLEEDVIVVVGRAPTVAAYWRTPLSLLFIDGGHTDEHVTNDYLGFGRWVMAGGLLVIHDCFEFPEDGGQAPWRCYRRALASGDWTETVALGSMRVLQRARGEAGDEVR